MKSMIFLVLFSVSFATGIAQSKYRAQAEELLWGPTDEYSAVSDVPDKWKNESAVILYKNVNYDYQKNASIVKYETSIRQRIKLLDQAAVEDFSEFYFTKRFVSTKGGVSYAYRLGSAVVGVKIIKPNGKEIILDVDNEAVDVDGETKIAISSLEVGDIIDYYFFKYEPFQSVYGYGFDPIENVLGEEYPVVDFKLVIKTENDFFVSFNTYNGAPALREIQTNQSRFRHYELTASDLEKHTEKRWFYPLVELPTYKFQVYYARVGSHENIAKSFLPEKQDVIKTNVSKQDVIDLYSRLLTPSLRIHSAIFKNHLSDKTFDSQTEKITEVYYFLRHYYFTRYFEPFYAEEAKIASQTGLYYETVPPIISDQIQFINDFTGVLKDEEIEYDIIIAKKRYDGSIDDLLMANNVSILLKVYTETPMYVEYFGPHTNINQISPLTEGTKAYSLKTSKNKITGIQEEVLPTSNHSQNEAKKEIRLTINEDFSNVSLSSINHFSGHIKTDEQYSRLKFYDYTYSDHKRYGTQSLVELISKKKVKEKVNQELDAHIIKMKEEQKEELKRIVEGEYELSEIDDYRYTITSSGRYGADSSFTYTEQFDIKNDLIKKAGPNYIFEIGKLIGGQVEITDKQRMRSENIYMEYPRTYTYEIKLEIPMGYQVTGLENLNKHVDNATGAFISTAKLEGDTLIVNTSKQYKSNYEPNSNWNLMIDFLDAAYQFTNEKVLLKTN